jgi:hypothetical protein
VLQPGAAGIGGGVLPLPPPTIGEPATAEPAVRIARAATVLIVLVIIVS